MQWLWEVGDQLLEDLEYERILDDVKIVQDQQEPALACQNIVDQRCTDDLAWGKLPGVEHTLDLPAQVRVYLLQCIDQISDKSPGIIVQGIEG